MFAQENSWRRMCPQYTAVAVSDGDGKMSGLRTCLAGGRRDYPGEEIKLPEPTTWAQIAPALPPADRKARGRAIVLAEGPKRELLRNPMKALRMAPTSAKGHRQALDALTRGQIMTATGTIEQQFRAIKASFFEQGKWSVARHREVFPEAKYQPLRWICLCPWPRGLRRRHVSLSRVKRLHQGSTHAILPGCWSLPEDEGVRTVGRLHPDKQGERLLRQRPMISGGAGSGGECDASVPAGPYLHLCGFVEHAGEEGDSRNKHPEWHWSSGV